MNEINKIVVGLDVHKKTIAVAVLYPGMNVVSERSTIENTVESVDQLAKRLSARGALSFCYEAGPCGYAVYRQLVGMGHGCAVIAPSLIPHKAGDRVKTDRRDAEKLARYFRAGELAVVHVPSVEDEGARDLVRLREDALEDQQRARHRLVKFLLRQGRVYREGKTWTQKHGQWLDQQRFEVSVLQQAYDMYVQMENEAHERLRRIEVQVLALAQEPAYTAVVKQLSCLKGVDTLSALTLALETHDFGRFRRAASYMGFTGLVSSEHSSGDRVWRGSITRTGNARLRRVLVEAAWHARHSVNRTGDALRKRRKGCPEKIVQIARRAEQRLHQRYWRLTQRGKKTQVAVVACARELAGFVWAIAKESGQKTVA